MDPLVALPAEIVLRILEFAPVSSIANLTRLNRTWHNFIDHLHQDAIYGSHSKTEHPPDVGSWKDLCRRQTLLRRNYHSPSPQVRDNFMVPLFDANRVWRFRTDLKRRFNVCTSQDGGLTVTDVDGKGRLWHLGHDEVPPFAHLEYSDGMAVWSTLGDALEVWKTDEPGLDRGEFRKVAVLFCPLNHLRGFHLAYNTLCVVGDDGQGLIYDMTSEPPRLRLHVDIMEGAVGHLCQAEEVVMYSMGTQGFHIHDKASGDLLGYIEHSRCTNTYHILHPNRPALGEAGSHQRSIPPLSSYTLHTEEANDVLMPIEVQEGPYPFAATDEELRTPVEEDEWGAGLLSGDFMVGISKAGRVFICANWRKAIHSEAGFRAHTSIIECEDNEENFMLGGWLSIRDNRILFEILNKVYLVSLNEDSTVATASQKEKRPSWCFFSALNPMLQRRLQSGISMMSLWDDCIMTTCWLPAHSEGRWLFGGGAAPARLPTKGVRILSLAPKLQ